METAHSLYVVRCTYGPKAHSLRESAMQEHLAYLKANRDRLRFAGPMLEDDAKTPNGSHAILESPDRAGAEQFIAEEAFYRAGMFDDIEITRFTSEVGNRQVHIQPDPARQMFLCQWTAAETSKYSDGDQIGLVEQDAVRVLESGPRLTDDATEVLGGLLILEVPHRAAAEAVVEQDTRRRSTTAAEIKIGLWRFGKALGGA